MPILRDRRQLELVFRARLAAYRASGVALGPPAADRALAELLARDVIDLAADPTRAPRRRGRAEPAPR